MVGPGFDIKQHQATIEKRVEFPAPIGSHCLKGRDGLAPAEDIYSDVLGQESLTKGCCSSRMVRILIKELSLSHSKEECEENRLKLQCPVQDCTTRRWLFLCQWPSHLTCIGCIIFVLQRPLEERSRHPDSKMRHKPRADGR